LQAGGKYMGATTNSKSSKTPTKTQEVIGKRERSLLSTLVLRYGVLFITIIVFIVFSLMQPRFITPRNIFNLIGQGSIIGLLALGLTNIIVVGEFDISFAAIATFCGVLSVFLVGATGMNLFLAWIICFAFGIGLSLFNAVNVVYVGIPSFIATLGLMGVLTGVSKWITGGSILYFAFMPRGFESIGRGMIANLIPSPVISFLIGALAVVVFLEYTYIGRYFYAVGGGREAARRAGVNVRKVKFLAFLVMGIIAGSSGLLMASMFGVGNPVMGDSFLFPAIISAFLGAVFLKEGIPNPSGAVVAAILLAIIANGLVMLGLPLYVKEIVQGAILVVAVAMVSLLKPGGIPGAKMG